MLDQYVPGKEENSNKLEVPYLHSTCFHRSPCHNKLLSSSRCEIVFVILVIKLAFILVIKRSSLASWRRVWQLEIEFSSSHRCYIVIIIIIIIHNNNNNNNIIINLLAFYLHFSQSLFTLTLLEEFLQKKSLGRNEVKFEIGWNLRFLHFLLSWACCAHTYCCSYQISPSNATRPWQGQHIFNAKL